MGMWNDMLGVVSPRELDDARSPACELLMHDSEMLAFMGPYLNNTRKANEIKNIFLAREEWCE